MKKKSIIILASVVVVCALGLLLSQVFNWPVDSNNASGNISKSSRFSRKTADAGMSNMQELLQNDETYRNNIVTAYYVMQTRTQEFDVLVDLSNKAAGGIPEFAGVLKDMNEAKPMIDNVCASMATAGKNLNTALSGEPCDELAESVTNSALAYTTLQKQNKLADQFIDVADKYLSKNKGSDDLKFVRDQWVDYQQMTAALDGDEKAAADLASKGHQLNADQTLAVLSSFDESVKNAIVQNGVVFNQMDLDIDSPLADVVSAETVRNVTHETVGNVTHETVGNVTHETVGNVTHETVGNVTHETVGNVTHETVGNVTHETVGNVTHETVGNITHETVGNITDIVKNNLVALNPETVRNLVNNIVVSMATEETVSNSIDLNK